MVHFAPEDVSLCSFASVRRTDVRSGFKSGPAGATENPHWQNTVTGLSGFVGVAAGRSIDLHAEWMVVPSASLAIGWVQNETRSRCIRSCGEPHLASAPYSDGGLQLETEIGSLLRFRRVFVGGAVRWVLGGMDPSLQNQGPVDGDQARLTVIRAGVTF